MAWHRLLVTALLTFAVLAYLGADPPRSNDGGPPRTDLYGDPLPEGAIARLGTVRFRDSYLEAVTLSPDGKTIAAAGSRGSILLWEVATGKVIRRLEPRKDDWFGAYALAWSPDGKMLASAGREREGSRIRLWDAGSGKEVRRLLLEKGTSVWKLAWSPDGRTLAWVDLHEGKTIRLRDAATGKEVRRLAGHQDEIYTIAWSPDGKRLASGSKDKTIRLWDPATGKEVQRLTGHKDAVEVVVWSPDGRTLASMGSDSTFHLWDPAAGKERERPADVEFLRWSPDGNTMACYCRDGTRQMRDARTGKALRTLADFEGWLLAWSPDGKMMISATARCIRLWDAASGKEIPPYIGHTDAANAVAWSPDGKTLASGSSDRTIRLWDPATSKEIRRLTGHEEDVESVAWSPDGKTLASGGRDKTIRLWDPANGKEVRRLTGHEKGVESVVWSPDGTMLASASFDKTIRLWEAATGKEIYRAASNSDGWVVSWSPDGRMLAFCGSEYNTVVLFDTMIRKEVFRIAREQFIKSGSWSPDGKVLASVNGDIQVRLWEAATGKEIRQLTDTKLRPYLNELGLIAWSPDGRLLASVDGWDRPIRLWDVATGKQVGQFLHPEGKISSVAWSPDSKRLAFANSDTTVLICAVNTPPGESSIRLDSAALQSCWADLAGEDAGKAHAAIRTLTRGATDSAPFLAKHLKPVAPLAEPQRVLRLIADLDNDAFSVRQKASEDLQALGELAAPALRRARENNPSPESRRRLEHLLDGMDRWSGERLAALRATAVLENSGNSEARQVLEVLAKGAPEARLTQEAKASLRRLARRNASAP